MLLRELLEKYQIQDLLPNVDLENIEFTDSEEKLFLLLWKEEQEWLCSVAVQIRKVLKTDGPEEVDKRFGELFFKDYSHTVQKVESGEWDSKEEAISECISAVRKKRSALVQEYLLTEKKRGLFSKKSYISTLYFADCRWSDFYEVALEVAESFLYSRSPDERKALAYLQICDQNNPKVRYLISCNMYADKEEKDRSLEAAIKEVQRLSAAGDVKAAGLYAKILLPNNPEDAYRYAGISASAGQAEGLYIKGHCLEKSLGGAAVSEDEALSLYIQAAASGHREAQCAAGRLLSRGTKSRTADPEKAIRYYQMAAEQGDAEAQYRTGVAYGEGKYVSKDPIKAILYCNLAAEKGHIPAQVYAAHCYANGIGTVRSLEKAFQYYKSAADQGNIEAAYQVGKIFSETLGTKQDYEQAFRYFKLAADAGHKEAEYQTAVCLMEGKGCKKNSAAAEDYLNRAAKQGHERALKKLVNLTGNDTTGPYLEKLAEGGNASALTKSAMAYFRGSGVEQDLDKAFRMFQQAADLGYKEARYRLGLCYKKGLGTPADAGAALHYFQLAADDGHLKAYQEAEAMAEQIRELEESGRLCREIELLNRERNYKKIFSLLRQYSDILEGKKEVQESLADFIELLIKQACKHIPKDPSVNYIQNIYKMGQLPEGVKIAEDFYQVALGFEKKKQYLQAITAYYFSATQGNQKAMLTLQNMATKNSRYFIALDESYLEA